MKIYDTTKSDENELRVAEILKQKLNIKTLTKTNSFHELDFMDENNTYYEIKGRNCNHDKYSTTMIGLNKINYIKKHNLNCMFVFSFNDGIYSYSYNCHDNFEIKKGGRNDRDEPEFKQYVYIPISKLNKI